MATYLKLKPGKREKRENLPPLTKEPHRGMERGRERERERESGESNKSAAHAAHTCDRKLKGEK